LALVAAVAQGHCQAGELAGGLLGQLLGRLLRPEGLRVAHDRAQDAQRLPRSGGEIGQAEGVDLLDGAREVGVHLEAIQVADHQEGRVLQRLAVVQQLLVGRRQVLALALVLPGEVAPFPDVGEAITAGRLLRALLEGVPVAGRVRLIGRGEAQHPAQIDEMLLGARALLGRAGGPLGGKFGRCHRPEE